MGKLYYPRAYLTQILVSCWGNSTGYTYLVAYPRVYISRNIRITRIYSYILVYTRMRPRGLITRRNFLQHKQKDFFFFHNQICDWAYCRRLSLCPPCFPASSYLSARQNFEQEKQKSTKFHKDKFICSWLGNYRVELFCATIFFFPTHFLTIIRVFHSRACNNGSTQHKKNENVCNVIMISVWAWFIAFEWL